MPNYAVIDLGSNSIRLEVYRVPSTRLKTVTGDDFSTLLDNKVMAGLAAYVKDGALTDQGVKKASRVLRGHLKAAGRFDCARCDIFATAVLRNASNSAEATAAIERSIGHVVHVISGAEEAHLGFAGASCDQPIDEGVLVDIGGASTEVSVVRAGEDAVHASVPQGSLSSFEAFVGNVVPTKGEIARIEEDFAARLGAAFGPDDLKAAELFGIGGSVRATAKVLAQMSGQPKRPDVLEPADVRAVLDACAADPSAFARSTLRACADRLHTVVPGCAILDVVMRATGAGSLRICKYGVREGYLAERMLKKRS